MRHLGLYVYGFMLTMTIATLATIEVAPEVQKMMQNYNKGARVTDGSGDGNGSVNDRTEDKGAIASFLRPSVSDATMAGFTAREQEKLQFSVLALDDSRIQILEDAMWHFEQLGTRAAPVLEEILSQPGYTRRVYLNTIYAVGRLGKNGAEASDVLFDYLEHDDPDFRLSAVSAFGKIGRAARHSVIYLRPLLHDESPTVRERTKTALLDINTSDAHRALAREGL